MRTDRLLREYEIEIRYRFFPLHPETPPEGMTLEELFAGRNIDVAKSQAAMTQRMMDEGLRYGTRTHTYNSRLAQELAKWAETQRPEVDFILALYQAYFVHGLNIGDKDVLLNVAMECGLPVQESREVLTTRSFSAAVDSDWSECRAIGLTGVPAFVVGQNGVVGAQPYEVLKKLVLNAGAKTRPVG